MLSAGAAGLWQMSVRDVRLSCLQPRLHHILYVATAYAVPSKLSVVRTFGVCYSVMRLLRSKIAEQHPTVAYLVAAYVCCHGWSYGGPNVSMYCELRQF
jgi:hypothetical protein